MPINKNIVGREITHEELQEDIFPDFGNDTINKEDTSHSITTPPRATATGAALNTFIFKNLSHTDEATALDLKAAKSDNHIDLLGTPSLTAKSTSDSLVISNGVIGFQDNKIYSIDVFMTVSPEVSSNTIVVSLATDTNNVHESDSIAINKIQTSRYSASIKGFVYESSMGDVKLVATNAITGGSTLDVFLIRVVIEETGEKV